MEYNYKISLVFFFCCCNTEELYRWEKKFGTETASKLKLTNAVL